MQRVSSNSTIILKIFVPTIWATFFLTFSIALLINDPQDLHGILSHPMFRWYFIGFVIIFFLLMYLTVIRLKRVELAKEGIYVSNYFKTYRYDYKDLKEIKLSNFGLFTLARFKMMSKTKMGKTIPVLLKRRYFEEFVLSYPEVFANKLRD